EIEDIVYLQLLPVGMKHSTLVGITARVCKEIYKCAGSAQAGPSAIDAKAGSIHAAAYLRMYQVGHAAIGFGADAIKCNGEDQLGRSVIVCQEQLAVFV